MTLDESIFTRLSADAGVVALCADRCYPIQVPEGTALPYVAWQRVSTSPVQAHDGPSDFEAGSYQFAVFAETFTAAHDLRNAIRVALDGVTLGNGAIGSVSNVRDSIETAPTPALFRSDIDIDFQGPS